jgi:hypothetical protein
MGLQPLRQFHVQQVARGQVDRHPLHAQRLQQRPLPRAGLEDPQRQLAHEAGLLGKRDEVQRRHHAARGVLPAHQRLGADSAPLGQRHLGLQEQAQLVAFQRAAQFGQQRQRLRAGRVDAASYTTQGGGLALGGVHRHLGAAQQRVGVGAVLRPAGNAEGGADVHRLLVQHQRLFEAPAMRVPRPRRAACRRRAAAARTRRRPDAPRRRRRAPPADRRCATACSRRSPEA